MKALKVAQKGFTLIEVMVVVGIIGILSLIAMPQYTQYIERARATEATSALASMRIGMEQFFQDNRTYIGGSCVAPIGTNLQFFAFNCSVAPGAAVYTLSAVGAGGMAGYQYNIDQNNLKTSVTPGSGGGNCWEIKRDAVAC